MAMQGLIRWCGRVPILLLGTFLVALLAGEDSVPADEETKTTALPADLAKIPSDGALVLSARVADLWRSELFKPAREKYKKEIDESVKKEFQDRFGIPLDHVERLTVFLLAPPPSPAEPLLLVRTAKPVDLATIVARVKNVKLKKYKNEMLYVGDKNWTIYPLDDQSLAYGELKNVNALIDHPQPKAEGNLAASLRQAAGKHSLVAGVNVKLFKESIGGQLPGEVEPFLPLMQALSATLRVDFAAHSRAEVVVAFAEEKEAKAARKPAEAGIVLLRAAVSGLLARVGKSEERPEPEWKDFLHLFQQFQESLKEMRVEQKDTTLQAKIDLKVDPAMAGRTVGDALQKIREAAVRTQGMNNLKQIALAMHNYADTMQGRLPAHAVYSKDGKPLLSWRVMILPYIEQQELYRQFHLNEPWDSEHNKKLLAKMPLVYASPQDQKAIKEHTTYYQGFFGKRAFFEGKRGLIFPAAFTDGLSNTIMIAEASKAVPWSKPEDIPFDPEQPLPKLGLPGFAYFLAAMGDGSVRTVSHKVSKETLRSAITRDGGEILGSDF